MELEAGRTNRPAAKTSAKACVQTGPGSCGGGAAPVAAITRLTVSPSIVRCLLEGRDDTEPSRTFMASLEALCQSGAQHRCSWLAFRRAWLALRCRWNKGMDGD